MGEFDGKVAFITGGARGQGRAHAVALAMGGASVVVVDVDQDIEECPYPLSRDSDLQETVRLVEEAGGRGLGITADVRSFEQVSAAVARATAEFGSVDILCANAGIWSAHLVAEMSIESWQTVIDVNLTGVFNSIRAVVPQMIEKKWGRIIATSSTAGRQAEIHMGNYGAAKWGVIGLIKCVALELGEHHITANAICPAMVRTGMTNNQPLYELFRPDVENPTVADIEEQIIRDKHVIPDAWIEPEEVSEIVTLLASERGKHISGTAIDITAGTSGRWSA